MNPCRGCGKDEPEVQFRSYPSGTRMPDCTVCGAAYQRRWRKKKDIKSRPDYAPECTQMRHPEPAFMEARVKEKIKEYADNTAKIKQAGLGVKAEAGACDRILKGM